MHLKTLQAPTMADAMRLVREELGEDAIIVSTTESEVDGVRITAAVERPETDLDVRGMGTDEALIERISDALDGHRVPQPLADKIVNIAAGLGTSDPLQTLAGALDLVFEFDPLGRMAPGRPVLLFGPPGAGKTSAVAKLAARAVLEGNKPVLITTDMVRAGARQQLEAYGERLDVPIEAVDSPDRLATKVAAAADRPVLIDTTSANPYLAEELADLRTFVEAVDGLNVLVMGAGREPLEAQDMATEFRKLAPNRLLVTGLDMSRRLGGVIAALDASGAAFAEVSATPGIVDGLSPVNPVMVARLLLEIANLRIPERDRGPVRTPDNRQATGWK